MNEDINRSYQNLEDNNTTVVRKKIRFNQCLCQQIRKIPNKWADYTCEGAWTMTGKQPQDYQKQRNNQTVVGSKPYTVQNKNIRSMNQRGF